MTETENKKSVKEQTNNVPEVKAHVPEVKAHVPEVKAHVPEVKAHVPADETVTVQFLRHCCTFEKGNEGRPHQIIHLKGSISSFKRSELDGIVLVEMFKERDISQLNLKPRLYIMLGQ